MICANCATEIPADSQTCGRCGMPVVLTARVIQNPQPESLSYDTIADKVGLVPNVRRSDNLLQAKIIGAMVALCALVGLIWGGSVGHSHPEMGVGAGCGVGVILGMVAGLVIGLLVSGVVIGIIGLRRKE